MISFEEIDFEWVGSIIPSLPVRSLKYNSSCVSVYLPTCLSLSFFRLSFLDSNLRNFYFVRTHNISIIRNILTHYNFLSQPISHGEQWHIVYSKHTHTQTQTAFINQHNHIAHHILFIILQAFFVFPVLWMISHHRTSFILSPHESWIYFVIEDKRHLCVRSQLRWSKVLLVAPNTHVYPDVRVYAGSCTATECAWTSRTLFWRNHFHHHFNFEKRQWKNEWKGWAQGWLINPAFVEREITFYTYTSIVKCMYMWPFASA